MLVMTECSEGLSRANAGSGKQRYKARKHTARWQPAAPAENLRLWLLKGASLYDLAFLEQDDTAWPCCPTCAACRSGIVLAITAMKADCSTILLAA